MESLPDPNKEMYYEVSDHAFLAFYTSALIGFIGGMEAYGVYVKPEDAKGCAESALVLSAIAGIMIYGLIADKKADDKEKRDAIS